MCSLIRRLLCKLTAALVMDLVLTTRLRQKLQPIRSPRKLPTSDCSLSSHLSVWGSIPGRAGILIIKIQPRIRSEVTNEEERREELNLQERDLKEDPGEDGRSILEWTLKKYC